jgi:hypothetical protein
VASGTARGDPFLAIMKEYRIDLHCYLKEQFNEIYEESKSRRERKKDEILQLVTPQD